MSLSEKAKNAAISKGVKLGKQISEHVIKILVKKTKNGNATKTRLAKKILRFVKRDRKHTKKLLKRINKTYKNKPEFKKCEDFCKNEYATEIDKLRSMVAKKIDKKYAKTFRRKNAFGPKESIINNCKKTYCNPKCEGFSQLAKKIGIDYKTTVKNGFKKYYLDEDIKALKEKGALSGCSMTAFDIHHK